MTEAGSAPGAASTDDTNRARRALLAHMRHDLRTPVNAIIGYSEMLLEDAAAGSAADLEKILAAGRTLLELINQILDPARLEGKDQVDLEAFGAEMRHHLRTPVNTVIGYSEMLLEEPAGLGAEAQADIGKIHESGNRLLALIDDILRLSQMASGQLELDVEASGLSTVIRDVVSAIGTAEAARPQVEGGRILIVDDNDVNLDMLGRRLERQGYAVVAATNGRQALELVREREFDLVLLDLMMPEMNGFQVLAHLKSDAALRHIPVIMISALDEMQSVVRCIEIGAEDYLAKPFDPVLLKARIGACLEKKRLRDREVSYLQQIEAEKARADALLHVILPDEIVEELKATNQVRPRRHESVAVLFCDIVGFTPYCATRTPEEILRHLQELFEAYEELAARFHMYKIKTIGDSFMSTAGLIEPVARPVLNAVSCGLEMVEAAHAQSAHWDVRVGIHCGPVMAGVVGRRQYLYDLWGDTVNTAARVESHGVKGSVCISGEAWPLVTDTFEGESLGLVPVKGKGTMEIVRVLGRRPGKQP
jgi:DNA-binding response OmpR family regulator